MNTRATPRLIVVGGFLGAGKTTCISALAERLLAENRKIGIVTNDQGSSLVDTEYLKSRGLPVMEVTGGCFCCNFDEFAARLRQMTQEQTPDYILAEPVGSCTDLIATLMKPIGRGLAGPFLLAPLSVVVDPKRLRKVLAEKESPFPNEINYLFKKQVEEADVIVVNKSDVVPEVELNVLADGLRKRYGDREILCVSAQEGRGIDEWLSLLSLPLPYRESLDIEYDAYARAEAALGWLNATCSVTAEAPFDANTLSESVAGGIRVRLASGGNEIAHLKVYMVSSYDFCKLSCVGIDEDVVFDKRMSLDCREASLVLNLRANAGPEHLRDVAEEALCVEAREHSTLISNLYVDSFSPSYPRPRHRE